MALTCGHGACYHCIVSKRTKNSPPNQRGTDHSGTRTSSITCRVCQTVSIVYPEQIANNLTVIDIYQMGLVHLKNLEMNRKAEGISFRRNSFVS